MKLAKYLMIAATSLGLLLGCNDKLDLEPSDSLTSGTAITDMDGLRAALTGAFDGMQSVNYYGRNYILIPELGADNVYLSKVNSNRFLSSYRREYTVLDSDVSGFWNTAYNVILRANNLIANVDNVPGDETEKNVAKGQALFIRALVHFDLTRIFAKPYNQGAGAQPGVPLILKFEVATPARAPLSEVYAQIIKDLTEAKGLLASTTIEEKLKPSKYAAAALLARVYLYQGNNAAAITEATEVINAGYTLTPAASFAGYFADPGAAEDIFTLHFLEVETLGSDNIGNMYLKPGYGDVRVSPDLRSIYDDADVRKKLIDTFSNSRAEWQSTKFISQNGIQGLNSPKILRLAEAYLIRAEANAKSNNFGAALADLTILRTQRGLGAITPVPADAAVLDAVLLEKRREFAFEGHRFFDLIRNGKDIVRNFCNNTYTATSGSCTIKADANIVVAPIPQTERNVNPLEQNQGYDQ